MNDINTLISRLSHHRDVEGDQVIFRFMLSLGAEDESLTWAELDQSARAFASSLMPFTAERRGTARQQPVVLALPAGAEFVTAYLGCLYAGAIAVPIRYPRPNRPLDHTLNVIKDSGASVIYTTREMNLSLIAAAAEIAVMTVADVRSGAASDWLDPKVAADDIAHLQYTSGSTSAPKGVAISHGNLMVQAREMCNCFDIQPHSRLQCWLPHYHDLGLVFGVIVPVHTGCTATLMPPTSFAQNPLSWLQVLSDHKITHSAAPNFAYHACLSIPEQARAALDLSAMRMLLNGAEPVRADTVAAFQEAFAPHGLGTRVQCPSYGMAENTLVISSNGPGCDIVTRRFDAEALQGRRLVPATPDTERLRDLVACNGSPMANRIAIVDPEACTVLPDGVMGEIWVAGRSVARGYWKRPTLTQARFEARLPGNDACWLRTGDLGGMLDGDLYIIGRMDDVMVLRGINYSPEDIEQTVESCAPELEPGGAVVFSADLGGAAQLVVAHELTRGALRIARRGGAEAQAMRDRLIKTIRAEVGEQHDLDLGALVLLPPKGMPKTHTGKKQRHACRRDFASGAFRGEMHWIAPRLAAAAPREANTTPIPPDTGKTTRVADLQAWLREYASTRINSRLMDERRTIPPHVVMDFGNMGLLGMVAPEEYGGLDLSNLEIVEVLQQLSAIDMTLASFTLVNNALGLRPILRYGQPALINRLMPELATGRKLASFAMTEANAGSNIRNLSARGIPSGKNRWQLWGTKWWSGTASWASVINTFARLEGPPGAPQGVSGFVLETGQPGLRQGPEALTMGLRAMVQNQVLLEGVEVSVEQRLGEIGDGMQPASDTMEYGRFAIAGMSLGILKRCLQLMVRHAKRRTIATGVLADNPTTRLHFAELGAATTAIEALVGVVASGLDAGKVLPIEFYCTCKTSGPESAWRAADRLIQQLAGRGFIETNIAPQILRDARVLRIFEGPTEPMNAHIGARLAHMPDGLCDFITQELGAPEVTSNLRTMSAEVLDYAQTRSDSFGGVQAAKSWAHVQIGEIASFGILIACLQYQSRQATTPALARALNWAHARFERRRAKALQASPAQDALLDRADLEETIAGFEQTIGDIEQSLAGEDHALDPLLTSEASAAPAAQAPPATAQDSKQSETALYVPVLDWLKTWMAAESSTERAEIGDDDRFAAFGMDSVAAQLLVGKLQDWLGVDLPATLVWEYRTVSALARYLAELPDIKIENTPLEAAKDDPLALLAGVDQLSQAELEALVAHYEDKP